jgi:hypothetical protein
MKAICLTALFLCCLLLLAASIFFTEMPPIAPKLWGCSLNRSRAQNGTGAEQRRAAALASPTIWQLGKNDFEKAGGAIASLVAPHRELTQLFAKRACPKAGTYKQQPARVRSPWKKSEHLIFMNF